MSEWNGIANGDGFTMDQKRDQRADADLPEMNDRQLIGMFGSASDYLKRLWRRGRIDLTTETNGRGALGLSLEQRDWWTTLGERSDTNGEII